MAKNCELAAYSPRAIPNCHRYGCGKCCYQFMIPRWEFGTGKGARNLKGNPSSNRIIESMYLNAYISMGDSREPG